MTPNGYKRLALRDLAREAIEVQNACNIGGVARRFTEVCTELYGLGIIGTDERNQHPIVKLWVSKMHDLARMGLSDPDAYHDAYMFCEELARD